jgi:hypothetical protein
VFRAVIFGKQRKLFADRMIGFVRILGEREIGKAKLDCDKCQANYSHRNKPPRSETTKRYASRPARNAKLKLCCECVNWRQLSGEAGRDPARLRVPRRDRAWSRAVADANIA